MQEDVEAQVTAISALSWAPAGFGLGTIFQPSAASRSIRVT
jgi:hypothetical protein